MVKNGNSWRPIRRQCLLICLVMAVAGQVWAAPSTSEPASEEGKSSKLVICISPNAPFFMPTDEGQWTGLEHDLLAAFAAEQGVEPAFFRPPQFQEIFSSLEDGRCDIGAATITKTEERKQRMDFSPSYFPVRIVAVEKRGAVTTRPEQLRGKRAATIPGSTYLAAIERIGGIEKVMVRNSQAMFEAVSAGKADFLTCDSAIVLAKAASFPDLQVTVALSDRDELAFALSKGSPWTDPLTRFLNRIRADGDMRDLLLRYFDAEGVDMILEDGH